MSKFSFSPEHIKGEVDRIRQRNLVRNRLFVLLLGPSATGKSTIIQEMNRQLDDGVFEYVKPVMTRENREGETDKISVSDAKFDQLDARGEFVVVNGLYGVRYGTPLSGIINPLQRGRTPILDYPLHSVASLKRPEYDTLNFYVYPSSIDEWRERMEASGRNIAGRLEAGIAELGMLAARNFRHEDIDASVVNANGAAAQAAEHIIRVIGEATS